MRGSRMEIILKENAVNRILGGTVFFEQNQPVTMLGLILKGKVYIKNSGMMIAAGTGSFLGICDLYMGIYQATYMAADDLTLYIFPVQSKDDLEKILGDNKEYRGFAVAAQNKFIKSIDKIHHDLTEGAEGLQEFLLDFYQKYSAVGRQTGYTAEPIPLLEKPLEYEKNSLLATETIEYYKECASIPLDIQKSYYSFHSGICMHHINEQSDILIQLMMECVEAADYISASFPGLFAKGEPCLFTGISDLAMNVDRVGGKNTDMITMLDAVIDQINRMEQMLLEKCGRRVSIERSEMEETYFKLISGTGQSEKNAELVLESAEDDWEEVEKELKNSLVRLLEYSQCTDEQTDAFKALLTKFKEISDLNNVDDVGRSVCRKLSAEFYDVYQAIFLRAYKEKNKSRMIGMFLNFGYMDESMLTQEQLLDLYHLDGDQEDDGPCSIYSIRQWLTLIYEMKKEPSKNEFDMNFDAYVREQVQTKRFTQEEAAQYMDNPLSRLEYEIKNVFAYNNRIVSGRMSGFVPVLYSDSLIKQPHKLFSAARDINAAVNRILMVDYSAFYRESMYSNPEKGIKKEYIMEEVFPEIILFPVFGNKGVMWQEITGKRRNTSARFLLPVFTDAPLQSILITLIGRFRWELCRTIQGGAWSDMTYPSLTSEYSDYIQFYKKNRELTEDRKEKVKLQLQKARSNMREVFVMDYLVWIDFEAKGSLRHNKLVRAIMAMYCPFSKTLREKVADLPMFAEAMARFDREKAKKVRELDLRMRALQKENAEITAEILDTFHFYKDM